MDAFISALFCSIPKFSNLRFQMSVQERMQRCRTGQRVLSIQSHVVSGYAGNKCAVLPLQVSPVRLCAILSCTASRWTSSTR